MNIKIFFVAMLLSFFTPLASAMDTLSNTVNVEATHVAYADNSDTVVVQVISLHPVPTLGAISLLLLALLMATIVVKRMYKPE